MSSGRIKMRMILQKIKTDITDKYKKKFGDWFIGIFRTLCDVFVVPKCRPGCEVGIAVVQ
jgi:hypothetical protein